MVGAPPAPPEPPRRARGARTPRARTTNSLDFGAAPAQPARGRSGTPRAPVLWLQPDAPSPRLVQADPRLLAALDLMRRMPPSRMESSLEGAPRLTEHLQGPMWQAQRRLRGAQTGTQLPLPL